MDLSHTKSVYIFFHTSGYCIKKFGGVGDDAVLHYTQTLHILTNSDPPECMSALELSLSTAKKLKKKEKLNTVELLRPGTQSLRMPDIFRYIFRKKLRALILSVCRRFTNQEYKAFFEIDSSSNLTCGILLEYY